MMIGIGARHWRLGLAVAVVLATSGPALASGGGSTNQPGHRYYTACAGSSEEVPRTRPAAESVPSTAGDTLWTKRYNGPGNLDDGATSVAVSSDGATVFVTGGGTGLTGGYSYTTIAYRASNGTKRWSSTYDGPSGGYDQATALGLSPDGSTVFVTGGSRGMGTSLDYATVAYDASSGAQLWVRRYTGAGRHVDYATALGVSPDGAIVFVTGLSPGAGHGDDYVTLAYSASTGATLWSRRYDGPGHASDAARGLAVSPDGSAVFVTGSSVGTTGHPDYTTVAYGATTGTRLWVKRYKGPANDVDEAHAVKVSPDGSTVFVTGNSDGSDGGFDYGTVAYEASTGAQLWAKRYSGPAQRDDYATALGVSPDGSAVFVTGFSVGVANRFDYATVAYDVSTGARLWVKRYNGPANDTDDANAVAVSPDSSMVLVTGASIGADFSIDYATVAYDASSGSQLWVRRYDGAAGRDDFAYALAIRPDGSAVYVTGESIGTGGFDDFATLAYSLR
jgi:WD40 repeat protein